MSLLAVETQHDGDRSTITVGGELDLSSAPELRAAADAALASPRCSVVVLDLAPLTFLDSSGMSCFVVLRQAATKLGKTVVLDHLPLFATRLLTLAGLASLFSLDEAASSP